jgi:uncharacterized protein YjiS (DUF1127 family)
MNLFETLTSIYGLDSRPSSQGGSFAYRLAEARTRAHQARAEAFGRAVDRFAKAAGKVWRAVVAALRERSIAYDLSRLDDRTLRDIGVSRSEIPYIARIYAWPVNDNDRRLAA